MPIYEKKTGIMKRLIKFLILAMIMMLLFSASVSAAQSNYGKDDGNSVSASVSTVKAPDINRSPGITEKTKTSENLGEPSESSPGIISKSQVQQRINDSDSLKLKDNIRGFQKNSIMEFSNLSVNEQNRLKNENQVRMAVQALLMTNGTPGIGQEISEIARGYNNSIKTTYMAEERIKNRNAIISMFFGGDNTSASEIFLNVEQNQQRIENLHQHINSCDCDEELRLMLKEQVIALEEEQNRLMLIAREEQKNKGLFGGLFG